MIEIGFGIPARKCEGYFNRANFERIIKEVYGEIPSPTSNADLESSSSGFFLDIQMEATRSLIDKEVLSYNYSIIVESYISKFRPTTLVSSTRNEDDVILEPCVAGERVYIILPKEVSDEYFYFYSRVIEDFKVRFPFTDFESDLLKTLNIAPSQLLLNEWRFIKAFEIVYDVIAIVPTLGLFFSLFKLKGAERRGWVSLSGIPGKSFLQAYTTNYKGFKEKFLQVKSGTRCPQVLYDLDGNHCLLFYW